MWIFKPWIKFEVVISKTDIISTATSSPDPLVFGDQLTSGQHLDLLKAIKPKWKEADERAIIDSSVFVDTREGALRESGEFLKPKGKGIFLMKILKLRCLT